MESLTSFLRTIRIAATVCVLAWGLWTLEQIVRDHGARGLYDTPESPSVSVAAVFSQHHFRVMVNSVFDQVLTFWRFGN